MLQVDDESTSVLMEHMYLAPDGWSHNGGASAAAGHAAPLASPAFASLEAAKILGGLPGGGCYDAPAVHRPRGGVARGRLARIDQEFGDQATRVCSADEGASSTAFAAS